MLQRHPFSLTRRWLSVTPLLLAAIVTAIGPLTAPIGVAGAATGPCAPLPNFSASNFAHDNGKPADIDNPYFPLEPGMTFVYLGTKDGAQTKNVMRVTHTVKMIHIDGHVLPTVQVHDLVYVAGKLEEETLDWYAQDRPGNVWYLGEDSTEIPTGSKAGSWEAGVDGARPGLIMEADPQVRDRYMQEFAPNQGAQDRAEVKGFVETMTVPYGTFHHVLKTQEGSCVEAGDEWKFYAAGVGNIRVQSLGHNGKPDGVEEQDLVSVKHDD